MRPQIQFPGKVEDVQLQFFGRFTWRDILRITAPSLPLYILSESLLPAAIGLLIGIMVYIFRLVRFTLEEKI